MKKLVLLLTMSLAFAFNLKESETCISFYILQEGEQGMGMLPQATTFICLAGELHSGMRQPYNKGQDQVIIGQKLDIKCKCERYGERSNVDFSNLERSSK